MQARSAEIAIIGAGPAGAHLASRLAAEGRDIVLFDPKGAWEKPCGGGVPTRAIREFAFLLESSSYPRKLVRQITMISPLDRRVTLTLDEPFAVYSREVLNGLVLDRAIEQGAEFVREAVCDFSSEPNGWTISTGCGNQWRAKFLVGADGASSFTRRRLVGIFPKRDLALAFGYNVVFDASATTCESNKNVERRSEAVGDVIVLRFPKDFVGYLWAFPRPGVVNFGVFCKLASAQTDISRKLLWAFISEYYQGVTPKTDSMSFFGAKVPALDASTWRELCTAGKGWALVGDAAGFADPITGEGIYYAFKSADLLAEELIKAVSFGSNHFSPNKERRPSVTDQTPGRYDDVTVGYERSWREVFGKELEQASNRLPRFYNGRFFGQLVIEAMIWIARYHRGVRDILVRILVGEQSHNKLKSDLVRSLPRVL